MSGFRLAEGDRRVLLAGVRASGVLRRGEFVLRSGLPSAHFFDFGRMHGGGGLRILGGCFARVVEYLGGVRVVFGPAYKGIPLATATVLALSLRGHLVGYLFRRKEAKEHGERGGFVGLAPGEGDGVLMVDDVFTDGGTKREQLAALRSEFPGVSVLACAVVLVRDERAARVFAEEEGVPVISLLSGEDVRGMVDGLV